MNIACVGIDHGIQKGSKVPETHLEHILDTCSSEREMDSWVHSKKFGICIKAAKGYAEALQDFHAVHSKNPSIKGMVYIDWGHSNTDPSTKFEGSFKGDLSFWGLGYPGDGIPSLVQQTTLFQHREKEKLVICLLAQEFFATFMDSSALYNLSEHI